MSDMRIKLILEAVDRVSATMRKVSSLFTAQAAQMNRSLKPVTKAVQNVTAPVQQLGATMQVTSMRMKFNMHGVEKAIDDVADAARQATPTMTRFGQRFNAQAKSMSENMQKTGKSMRDMGGKMSLVMTTPLALLTRQSMGVQKQFDAMRAKMIGSLKSTDLAEEQMKRLRTESDRMGTVFIATADDYAGLAASFLGAGFSMGQVNDMFKDFTETAVAMGSTPEKLSLINKALEQMAGKPAIQMEELKGQLADHIPNAVGIAAKAMGLGTDKFLKFVEAGRISSKTFLPRFAAQMKKELGGGFEEASKSLQAIENRQKNIFDAAELQGNKSGLQDFYIRLREIVKDLAKGFMDLSPGMQKFVVYTAIGAMIIGPIVAGIGALATGVGVLAGELVLMSTAMMATPFGWFMLAFAAVIGLTALIIKNWGPISTFFSNLWSEIKLMFKEGAEYVTQMLEPLVKWIDRIGNSNFVQGVRGFFGGDKKPSQAELNADYRARGPAVPFADDDALGPSKVDAGGTIKIKIDSTGQARVQDMKANDGRIGYKVDTGLLMSGAG